MSPWRSIALNVTPECKIAGTSMSWKSLWEGSIILSPAYA